MSCEHVQIKLGYYLPFNQVLVVDEIKISKKAYTKSPTLFLTVMWQLAIVTLNSALVLIKRMIYCLTWAFTRHTLEHIQCLR